jgi:phosphohistidine phosphatase
MKTLWLIRHSKAEKDGKKDFDRELTKKGKEDAKKMGDVLKNRNVLPELIQSSPANRALATAKIFADELGYDKDKIIVESALYSFDLEQMIAIVESTDDHIASLMIVSHNPTIAQLTMKLGRIGIEKFPTTGVFQLETDIETWKQASEGNYKLVFSDFPKNHSTEIEEE